MASFLILQAARFGDLVQSKRLIRTIERLGNAHLAVENGLVSLARLLYPTVTVHGLSLHGQPEYAALQQNRGVLAKWRGLGFQAVYNCNFSGITSALCRIFDPDIVYGYRPAPGGILRSPWARAAFRLSERRYLSPLNLTDFWAYFVGNPLNPDMVNPQAAPGGQGVGVALAGRDARRSLPVPLLSNIIRAVFSALEGPRIRLFGSKTEQPAARKLLRLLPSNIVEHTDDLTGKTDWRSLIQSIMGLDMMITPDTGIMHLAAHLGVPMQAFFLSSAWCHETGPYGEGHCVWQASRDCAPCLESRPCPDRMACITPFQNSSLLRVLNAVLRKKNLADATLPDGLQIWQSGLDALGGTMKLLAGRDEHAIQRALLREQLKKILRLSENNAVFNPSAGGDAAAMTELLYWFCTDSDWILPVRYC
ncbi:MAG: glycosyltransferase family 9 protein [Desulfovibrio sp.]|jgi:hypothetical protein|nr:glycosyltransferase family 9 protein [Desulfovibrio sp.]